MIFLFIVNGIQVLLVSYCFCLQAEKLLLQRVKSGHDHLRHIHEFTLNANQLVRSTHLASVRLLESVNDVSECVV